MHGPGDSVFDKLFYDLFALEPQAMVQAGDGEHCVILFPNGQRTAIFRYSEDPALFSRITTAMKSVPEVVLVGGPPEAAARLKGARPFFTRVAVSTIHLPDGGAPVHTKKPALRTPVMRVVASGIVGAPSAEAWSALVTRVSTQHELLHAESTHFAEVHTSRRPIGTYALLAVIAAMFATELALGGSERNVVLVRLGGLVPGLVRHEPWRLFASAFLHIGWAHVLVNSYVLFVIGGFLERVIGTWRFLVVFWLSVLGGSLMSLWVSPAGLTAGASGGVIGLLAAQGLLAFRPHGLLPKTLIPGAKRAALTNLAINVFNSLRPGVSLTAHLGGALVGAGLVFTPWLVAGLPKLGDDEATTTRGIDPPWIRPVALLGVAAMSLSLIFALVGGASLLGAPKLVATQLGTHTISLPSGLRGVPATTTGPEGTSTRLEAGDLTRDPVAYVVIHTELVKSLTEAERSEVWRAVKQSIAKPESGFGAVGTVREQQVGPHQFATARAERNDHALEKVTTCYVTSTELILVTTYFFSGEVSGPDSAERALATFDAK